MRICMPLMFIQSLKLGGKRDVEVGKIVRQRTEEGQNSRKQQWVSGWETNPLFSSKPVSSLGQQ